MIAFAAAPGAVAADGGGGNSPFTTALLQWIDRPNLEIGLMFRKVRGTVMALTDEQQVPWVEESLVEEVYLRRVALPPGAESELDSLAELLSASLEEFEHPAERRAALAFYDRIVPDHEDQAALAGSSEEPPDFVLAGLEWLSIRETDDPEVLRAFLGDNPNGPFTELAETQLRILEATQEAAAAVPGALEVEAPAPLEAVSSSSSAPQMELGDAERRAVQLMLTAAGHYRGEVDGIIGSSSRAALSAFQAEVGLPETGAVEPATLRALVDAAVRPALLTDAPADERLALHRLAAQAHGGPGAEPVTLRVAHQRPYDEELEHWDRVARTFEADHPGVIVTFDIRWLREYRSDLLAMLGDTAPPDVFVTFGGGHLRSLVEAGFARDLTEAFGDDWTLRYKPSSFQNIMVNGRVYAVPSRMNVVSLWANRALLDKAGVDPASLASWEGFLDGVERLRTAGITPLAVGTAEEWPMHFYWAGLAQAIGGPEAIAEALAGEGAGFAGPAFVEAGRRLEELVALDPFQPGHTGMDENHALGVFTDGWAAMTLDGDWIRARLVQSWPGGPERAAAELVRIPFPPGGLGAGDQAMTYGGTDSWVVREGAPEVALDLVLALESLASQSELAALGFKVSTIAGADLAIEDPILRDVAAEVTLSEHHQLYLDQLLGPVAGAVVDDAAVALATGQTTPERAALAIERAWAPFRESWGGGPDSASDAVPTAAN